LELSTRAIWAKVSPWSIRQGRRIVCFVTYINALYTVFLKIVFAAIHAYGIRAFPTYVLFQNGGKETSRVEGVNMNGIENMIVAAASTMQMTGGQALSTDGAAVLSPTEARAARLAKLGAASPSVLLPASPVCPPATTVVPADPGKDDVDMSDTAAAPDAATSTKDADGDTKMDEVVEEEMVDPTVDLDPVAVKILTEEMGFPLIRAQKGLLNGNARSVEAAVDWLTNHQDDDDIDEPIPKEAKGGGGAVAQSYKCNECGKILSNMANLELHANKTGHSDFEESTQHVKPLTPEEKEAKIAQIKELLKAKRAEREGKLQYFVRVHSFNFGMLLFHKPLIKFLTHTHCNE
jgi:UBX domain-containing protein 1/4